MNVDDLMDCGRGTVGQGPGECVDLPAAVRCGVHEPTVGCPGPLSRLGLGDPAAANALASVAREGGRRPWRRILACTEKGLASNPCSTSQARTARACSITV